ncbi:MAG: molybdopterin-guanine dinucleotide biosynthesis protein B [Candidatus Wallbacteria bacterium]|nr:molybdopterin-guanine dinucleotide biosynthesis protein B [Candidatus Wallbacteria bacterium]
MSLLSIPMLAIVGHSGAGKTTLIEKLLPLLTQRGLRVGTLKHDAHGAEPDREGKDTWRHAQAGARVVILSGPRCLVVRHAVRKDADPEELSRFFEEEIDLALVEGYSLSELPKIEVYSPLETKPSRLNDTSGLLATVRAPQAFDGIPNFDDSGLNALADRVESWHLDWRQSGVLPKATPEREAGVRLVIDGRELVLKPFLNRMLAGLVFGFLSALRGVGLPSRVEIALSRQPFPPDTKSGQS